MLGQNDIMILKNIIRARPSQDKIRPDSQFHQVVMSSGDEKFHVVL